MSAYQNIRIVVNDQDVARCANHSVEEFHQERPLNRFVEEGEHAFALRQR
jgi:hypothetical protein